VPLPSADADELSWVLFRQRAVISRRQALAMMPEARLRRYVATGRWANPYRGIYVAHNGPLDDEQRVWIGILGAGHGWLAPLAGTSALFAWGLRGYEDQTVHVYVPKAMRRTRPPDFVMVHRTHTLVRADLPGGSPPRTSASRAAIDAARWTYRDDRARAIIAAAFQQRLVDGPGMLATLGRLSRVRRRRLILETIQDAAGGTESISEQDFLRLCRRGGLPTPTRQAVVTDASGRRRYRDAYFKPWKVHVEIDGGLHMDVRSWWADMQRQNEMWVAGDRVLRFPAWAVRNEPDQVLATIRDALMAAGWCP
jgi:hypothetical protein